MENRKMIISNQISRVKWIDALKGIAIIGVIWQHCHNGYNLSGFDRLFLKWIVSFHMPLFFVAAGFCHTKKNNFINNVKNKFKALFVPYLIWGGIGFLLENLRVIIQGQYSLKSIRQELLDIITGQKAYLACWFLLVLLGVYVIEFEFEYFEFKFKNKYKTTIVHFVLLILGYIIGKFDFSSFYRIRLILISCFFFWFGTKIKDFIYNLDKYKLLITISSILIGGILAQYNGWITYSNEEFGNPIVAIVSALLSILGLFLLFYYSYKKYEFRILEFYGKNSIIVLCTHLICLYGIRILEKVIGIEIHTFPIVGSFLLIMMSEMLLIKFMPSFMYLAFGKRK